MQLSNKHKINPYKANFSKYSTHSIIKSLLINLPLGSDILDVGCNDGYIGKYLNSKYNFYGLDYLESSVIESRKYYKECSFFDLNNLTELPWDTRFDAIIFGDVLEHVLDSKSVLKFFVEKYLDSEGFVIISLPNVANWQIRLQLLFGYFKYTDTGILDKTHLHLYTYQTAGILADECGLKVLDSFGGASFFGPLLKYVSFLKPLLATGIILICQKK